MDREYTICHDQRSGNAHVLGEQSDSIPDFSLTGRPLELLIEQPKIGLSQRDPGVWQFLYMSDLGLHDWINTALVKLYGQASGSDRAYAELALKQGAHVSAKEPRIYNAPEGGVILENRTERGILTLLIEGSVGILSRSADNFQVSAHFHLSPYSINEMLARYICEMKLLQLGVDS